MSHEIDKMAYSGSKPWHNLGTAVSQAMNINEALELGGLNWEVGLKDVYDSSGKVIPGYSAITRLDRGTTLSIMGKRYVPLQNREAFTALDDLVQDGLRYETVGSLKGGRVIWGLAKLPGNIQVTGKDIIEKYLLFTNSHDGTKAISLYFTPIRVVCWNTLSLSQLSADYLLRAKHTKNASTKISSLKSLFIDVNKQAEVLKMNADKMMDKAVSEEIIDQFLVNLFMRENGIELDDVPTRTKNQIEQVKELVQTGKGTDLDGVKGSAWGLYNAVTEYVDHYAPTRSADPSERAENKLHSAWFNGGAKMKEEAYNNILDMVAV